MALPELIANSPVPGTKTLVATLGANVATTPAAGTVETWTYTSATLMGTLGLTKPGQYHFVIGSEICIDVTGGGGTARQIQRGAEGSTVATHASGDSIFHDLTAEALKNLIGAGTPVAANTAARAYRGSAYTLALSTWTKFPVDTVVTGSDPGGHIDAANNRYKVTVAGWYQVNGELSINTSTTTDAFTLAIYKNGGKVVNGSTASGNAITEACPTISDLVYCAAGDYLELWYYASPARAVYAPDATQNYLSVVQVDQVGQMTPGVAQSPPGAFSAHTSAAAQLGSGGSSAKVALNTVDYDLSSAFSTTNNRFQPTQAGYYHIDAGVQSTPGLPDGDQIFIVLYKNGSALPNGAALASTSQGSTGSNFGLNCVTSALVYLNGTTDYVELWGLARVNATTQEAATFNGWMTGFMATAALPVPTPAASAKNLVVQGPVAVPVGNANVLPPFFVSVPAGGSLKLAYVRAVIQAGTSVTFSIYRNGAPATGFTGIVATTTAALTDPTDIALADGDVLQVVVTAVSGSPYNLTVMVGLV